MEKGKEGRKEETGEGNRASVNRNLKKKQDEPKTVTRRQHRKRASEGLPRSLNH